ncbi:MAG: hypothetical protein ACTSRS_14550 [Candidatus Helarchaeota archaeon]
MDKNYIPLLAFLIFFLYNAIAGILLYLGINTTNSLPPDPISLGQLLFLIFGINAPLLVLIGYAFYKQRQKSRE